MCSNLKIVTSGVEKMQKMQCPFRYGTGSAQNVLQSYDLDKLVIVIKFYFKSGLSVKPYKRTLA